MRLVEWAFDLVTNDSPLSITFCSSSSPTQRVGRVGRSTVERVLTVTSPDEATVSSRGSQKSNSVSEMDERGKGEGEGDKDGQALAERRSEAWLAVTEGGWMKTEFKRDHFSLARPPPINS